ncbi:MAG TPA: hypothetical protein VKV40_01330 [Ktedonobacteraceae bacterium]|nr:hypothetical protein [Ktedonobacteraceae bacterium]
MSNIAQGIHSDLIPKFPHVRRVPPRYRRILALNVMKLHLCAVIGSAPGILTVAITDCSNTSLIEALGQLTGCRIFPVLVEPRRMRLLIQRVEFYECRRYRRMQPSSFLHPRQSHLVVSLLCR